MTSSASNPDSRKKTSSDEGGGTSGNAGKNRIKFQCGMCGATLTASLDLAGKPGKCDQCGDVLRVPSLKPPAAAPPLPVSPHRALAPSTLPTPPTTHPPRYSLAGVVVATLYAIAAAQIALGLWWAASGLIDSSHAATLEALEARRAAGLLWGVCSVGSGVATLAMAVLVDLVRGIAASVGSLRDMRSGTGPATPPATPPTTPPKIS